MQRHRSNIGNGAGEDAGYRDLMRTWDERQAAAQSTTRSVLSTTARGGLAKYPMTQFRLGSVASVSKSP